MAEHQTEQLWRPGPGAGDRPEAWWEQASPEFLERFVRAAILLITLAAIGLLVGSVVPKGATAAELTAISVAAVFAVVLGQYGAPRLVRAALR